jgi:predicted acylesterase/phospholipase RssA
MKILEKLIEAKYDKSITFKELFEKTNKKLVINTLCLCDNTSLSLNYIDNPDLSILFAIKMSISIPYIFPFVEHEEKYYAGGICQPLYHTYGDDHLIITIGKQVVNNSSMTMKEKQKDKFYLLKQLMQSIGHNTSSGENILTIPNNGIHFLSNPTDIERMNMIQSGFIGIIEFCEK